MRRVVTGLERAAWAVVVAGVVPLAAVGLAVGWFFADEG